MAKQIPGKCFRCGKPIELGYTLCMTCAYKLRTETPIPTEAELEDIKYDICRNYCKYTDTWDEEAEGMELCESDICANCPLNRL